MSEEERELLDESLVKELNDLPVNHSSCRDTIGMETLLARVEELREAPKWTLGQDYIAMPKARSRVIASGLKKAEKLHDALVRDLETFIGDGMLVFREPVFIPGEDPQEEGPSFTRIYQTEEWDEDEYEYEYWFRCDADPFEDGISLWELGLDVLLEVFSRIRLGEALLFSEEEVAACGGLPTIAENPDEKAFWKKLERLMGQDEGD